MRDTPVFFGALLSLFLGVLFIRLLFLLLPHPLHISVTEVEYNQQQKSLQVMTRIFIDDLQLAMAAQLKEEDLDILSPGKGRSTDELVKAYLATHFKIKIDGKPAKMNYLAHEIEEPAIVCYIEIESVKKFKRLEFTNDVIQEIHADQSNLVHVKYIGPVKSLRLMKDKPTDILKFD